MNVREYGLVTAAYWGFTVTDGAPADDLDLVGEVPVSEHTAHEGQIRRGVYQDVRCEHTEALPLQFFSDRIPRFPIDGSAGYHHHTPIAIPVPVTAAIDAVFCVGELPVTSWCESVVTSAPR